MTEVAVEEVARRLSRRPGYRLVTYREVGLPFWEVPVRCRVLAKKTLSVLHEFVLRCVNAELLISSEVSSFLGLPASVVEVVMAELVVRGHIVPTANVSQNGEIHYAISERGKKMVQSLSEVVAEERTLKVAYDGLTGTYCVVDASLRWRPRDLRDHDILEIPAFPADPPPVGPDVTAPVASALTEVTQKSAREILTVIGLDGKREKFFLRALALVFESIDKVDEVYVHFAIDGRPSEAHDLAFAKAEGQRKIGILGSLHQADPAIDAVLGDEIIRQRADDVEVATIRRTTERYQVQLRDLESRSHNATAEQRETLADQSAEVARNLDEAQAALEQIPVRVLEVHEHSPLLTRALRTARSRLLIVSPWIRAAVVDDTFISDIDGLLTAGVEVSIAYGIDDSKPTTEKDRKAESKLQALAAEHPNFSFVRLGDTHAKILIVDERYAVVTSFNWLSFRGDPTRPFRDERGTLITIVPEIERLYDSYKQRMIPASGRELAA